MSQNKVVTKKEIRRLRSIFNCTNYNLRILAKIYPGYRPSQIAQQLRISDQNVNYYSSNLIDLELIEKVGNGKGIAWRVTEKGSFVLKQFIRGSVNSYNYQNDCNHFFYNAEIPIRLHNVSFAFKINSSLDHLRIQWRDMKNGIARHTIMKKDNQGGHTVELFKSPQ